MKRQERFILILILALLLVEFFLVVEIPFFWDAGSKAGRAKWILDHNFTALIVPAEINSGHPPLWITSIALMWKMFGYGLWPVRLLMIAVNFGVCYQVVQLAKRFFPQGMSLSFVFLILLEPTVLAQTTSMNNDMLLLFFTLLGFNMLLRNSWQWFAVALTGLLLTNLRGIYCFVAIAAIHFMLTRRELLLFHKKMVLSYLLALIPFAVFLYYQYQALGWMLIAPSGSYSEHREVAGSQLVLKNMVAFAKCMLEFGRIFLLLILAWLLWPFFRRKRKLDNPSQILLIATLSLTAIFMLGFIPFSNPFGPRYLMICFILNTVLVLRLIFVNDALKKFRKALVATVVVIFVSGQFWVYPATISQAWDSTLLHTRYFALEKQMLNYLSDAGIPNDEVGTFLPLNNRQITTAGEHPEFNPHFANPNLKNSKYILYSNIENTIKDNDLETLRRDWIAEKHFSSLGVFIVLYKSPNH